MRTAQQGDRVQVHYVMRREDGFETSSRGRGPLELTVGVRHPRLPGLDLALVGMAPGARKTVTVPPERAYGLRDPARVRSCSRKRFPEQATLEIGQRVPITDGRGRRRLVRILQLDSRMAIVDVNHRWAGQTLVLEVELLAIADSAPGPDPKGPGQPTLEQERAGKDPWRDDGGEA
jgi:peptidylprolyl isomerase